MNPIQHVRVKIFARQPAPDAVFGPEISVSRQLELDMAPTAEVWSFPFATVARSERGFEETVQGTSYTPRWPVRAAAGRVTLRLKL